MASIFVVLLAFLGLGASLAAGWNPLPIRSGYLGGVLLVGAAIWAKTHWRSRAAVGDDPGGAERRAWLYVAGTALICGFVGVILMTPGSEVHRYTGDTGGHDSWIMFGGGLIAWWLLHDARAPVDERDRAIDAFSNRVGYSALVIMLLFFLFTLGFAPKPMMARFTHWLIANTLLTIIMLATLAQYLTQLIAYWRGRRGATEMRTRDVG